MGRIVLVIQGTMSWDFFHLVFSSNCSSWSNYGKACIANIVDIGHEVLTLLSMTLVSDGFAVLEYCTDVNDNGKAKPSFTGVKDTAKFRLRIVKWPPDWTCQISNLSDTEHIILNQSDTIFIRYTEPVGFWTYEISKISDTTYQLTNLSYTEPTKYQTVSSSPFKYLDDRQTPPCTSHGETGAETDPSRPHPHTRVQRFLKLNKSPASVAR